MKVQGDRQEVMNAPNCSRKAEAVGRQVNPVINHLAPTVIINERRSKHGN